MALDTVRANCPADWQAAIGDSVAFAEEHKGQPMFTAAVSTEPCRGQLHYTRHMFDAGPRYCLYDPSSKQLTGYGAFDGKANHREWSCERPRSDYDDQGCAMR